MEFMKSLAPFGVMVLYEFGEVVMTILAKAAMNSGISNFSYLVYYNVLGFILFLPYFFLQYYRSRPSPLTLPLLFRCFILGLVGKCVPLLGLVGLDYSSPDMSAALGNLTVTFTFLLAVIFKMEKLDLRNSSSQAKSLGSTIAVSGALVMTLYKGPPLVAMKDEPSSNTLLPHVLLTAQPNRWALGGLLLTINYFFCSAWSVIQTSTVKKYPQETTILFFFLVFGSMQCAIVSVTVERNPSAWKLHPGIQIIAVIYSAIFGTGISYILITWCLKAKGPLYVAMFKPLGVVLTDLCAIIFLGDKLHLGSLIGTIMIGAGFYTVLWGQAKEKEEAKFSACKIESSTQDIDIDRDTPLLKDCNAYEA